MGVNCESFLAAALSCASGIFSESSSVGYLEVAFSFASRPTEACKSLNVLEIISFAV